MPRSIPNTDRTASHFTRGCPSGARPTGSGVGRWPARPESLYFCDDFFWPTRLGFKLLVNLVLNGCPEFAELRLSELSQPCGEETKPYHLNDLYGSLQAQILPRDVILLANLWNNIVPYPTP